jgi:cation diffusion facilitator CzcD-associated flavoprotein CzcO
VHGLQSRLEKPGPESSGFQAAPGNREIPVMTENQSPIQLDVLIIGAGLSGLGMAYRLKTERPDDRFQIIESRADIGGTWDLFRYPGIRSDSDMYSFAYSFKPWTRSEFLGTGPQIKNYLRELVDEHRLDESIRFQRRVTHASWDSRKARWLVTVRRSDDSEYQIETGFLVTCTGYYNYDQGYLPDFPGMTSFRGVIAHPQHWPEGLDYEGKRVLVIGSGATAVTIVPAMADKAGHVTMVQRSPGYIMSLPSSDWLYSLVSRLMPAKVANRIMRAKYVLMQQMIYILSRRYPDATRKMIRRQNRKALNGSTDADVHFNPRYKPWDQRMCMAPDADLFKSLRSGRASIVTDEIERFTERGLKLTSGTEIEADIVVPATGLDIQLWGGMTLDVDGEKVEAASLTNYKGMMFSQIPNFVTIFGYTNAPWTLKAELTYGYVIRLLNHMQHKSHRMVHPHLQEAGKQEAVVGLQSGYILRARDRLPKQGASYPWRNKDLYLSDIFAIKHSPLDDKVLRFDDPRSLAGFHRSSMKPPNQRFQEAKKPVS